MFGKKLPLIRNFLLRHHTRALSRAAEKGMAERTVSELAALAAADPAIARILREFGAGEWELKELYGFLIDGGANRWVYGNYVAAASFTNPVVIYAYLRDRHRKNEAGFCLSFVDTCIRYIEGGYGENFLLGMFKVPHTFSTAFR